MAGGILDRHHHHYHHRQAGWEPGRGGGCFFLRGGAGRESGLSLAAPGLASGSLGPDRLF